MHLQLAQATVRSTEPLAFDMDNYRLALKYLTPPGKPSATVVELRASRHIGL